MQERLRAFAWILGSGCFGAALGTGFGALAGLLYWRSGRVAGTKVGLRLVEAFERLSGRELSRPTKGTLVGAVDGCLFLGAIGTVVGAVAVWSGAVPAGMLKPAVLGALQLVGGAAFLGMLGYSLTRAGVGALAVVALGGLMGAGAGWLAAGVGGLLFGSVLGMVAGNVIGLLRPRYQPEFVKPHLQQDLPGPHRGKGDGIQGSPGIEPAGE